MPRWQIQRMVRGHDRSQFDSGVAALNVWLQALAGQYERRDLARTYLAVRLGESRVLGYYAISNHRVSYEALPAEQARGLPRIDVPVVLLGRLAVDRSVQGQGLGALLLVDALKRADYLSEQIGLRAVEVEAVDERARRFYLKYGFVELLDDPHHLFLPMRVIRKLHLTP